MALYFYAKNKNKNSNVFNSNNYEAYNGACEAKKRYVKVRRLHFRLTINALGRFTRPVTFPHISGNALLESTVNSDFWLRILSILAILYVNEKKKFQRNLHKTRLSSVWNVFTILWWCLVVFYWPFPAEIQPTSRIWLLMYWTMQTAVMPDTSSTSKYVPISIRSGIYIQQ